MNSLVMQSITRCGHAFALTRPLLEAQYWISRTRDCALSLACRRRGLPAYYGQGFDDLPVNVRAAFKTLATSLERDELLRVLANVINGLLVKVTKFRNWRKK